MLPDTSMLSCSLARLPFSSLTSCTWREFGRGIVQVLIVMPFVRYSMLICVPNM